MQKKGMELEGLVKSGDVVLAGVSGGADSVCLLLMLLEYRKHCDFFLEAVHVEHGIRGDASRRDAAFVKRLCEKRGVCCRIYLRLLRCVFNAGFIRWMSRRMQRDTASALRRRRGSSAMSASGRQQRTMAADR